MTDNTNTTTDETAEPWQVADENGDYAETLVPHWPGPVTNQHYDLIAENGMKSIEDLTAHFTTADLAFWLTLTARLGRTPTYADLKAIEDRVRAQQGPAPHKIPSVLANALSVYYPQY